MNKQFEYIGNRYSIIANGKVIKNPYSWVSNILNKIAPQLLKIKSIGAKVNFFLKNYLKLSTHFYSQHIVIGTCAKSIEENMIAWFQ